jgi:hypothetical protein
MINEDEFLEKAKGIKDLKKLIALHKTLSNKALMKNERENPLEIVDAVKNGDTFDFTAKDDMDEYQLVNKDGKVHVTVDGKVKTFDDLDAAVEGICARSHARKQGKEVW